MFVLRDVSAGYDGNAVFSGISLEIPAGVFVLVGPSGCGKSTLLRLLNRMTDPMSGEILYRGEPLRNYPVRQLRRKVAMVFQKPILFDGTVADNILFASPELSLDDMKNLLTRVALPVEYIGRKKDELSVGEAQRVCLARTLATEPEVLLLDEPTSALDPTAVRTIEELLLGLAKDISLIWVTHTIEQAIRIGGNAAMLYNGKIQWYGETRLLPEADEETVRKFISGKLK